MNAILPLPLPPALLLGAAGALAWLLFRGEGRDEAAGRAAAAPREDEDWFAWPDRGGDAPPAAAPRNAPAGPRRGGAERGALLREVFAGGPLTRAAAQAALRARGVPERTARRWLAAGSGRFTPPDAAGRFALAQP